jgi:hydrogenase maturation protease
MATPRILVIAYGNPLRSDDGLAWRAAEKLAQLEFPENVEIVTHDQLTPELALAASEISFVLFLDAARPGMPGEIVSAEIRPERQPSIFTHDFSPGAILSTAEELYGHCPEALALSLVGECFDHGETLSDKVKESMPKFVTLASEWIRKVAAPQ